MHNWACSRADPFVLGFVALFMLVIAGGLISLPVWAADLPGGWYLFFLVLALPCGAFGAVIALSAIAYARTAILIDGRRLAATLPTWRGSLAGPPMRDLNFDLGELSGIEVRQEIQTFLGNGVVRSALAVLAPGGERIVLYRSLADKPGALPVGEIAAAMGAAAGTKVIDHGIVRAGSWLRGTAETWDAEAMGGEEVERVRSSTAAWGTALTVIFIVVAIIRGCEAMR